MRLIVFSSPNQVDNEAELVNKMFENGLELFHLRKPGLALEHYSECIKKLEPKYLKRIMIHDHFSLISRYNIKGLHFSGEFLEHGAVDVKNLIRVAKTRSLALSKSIHNLQELLDKQKAYSHLFVSPVYDSISKSGYKSKIDLKEASSILQRQSFPQDIIALGGVDEEKLAELKNAGFDGAALLGAIWNSPDPVKKWLKIKEIADDL